ncbi:MAG: methyltransferase domain-containing protein [Pedobacter sp.]|nr:MAG: methyltransferase domain-containing protein [Pedobacter sp.]
MDIYGQALSDYYYKNQPETLWLNNSYAEPEEMPVEVFFRGKEDMPELELKALSLCKGRILDVGAGVGSHALLLQEAGHDITAIDISEKAVEIMQARGVRNAYVQDILKLNEKYDTLLFLMNGIGLTGTLKGLAAFLELAKSFLNPGGQLLFDSSDISYLYTAAPLPEHHYFGEIRFQYEYKGQIGKWFKWVYVDQVMLKQMTYAAGWQMEKLYEDGNDQYLVRLTLI